METRSVSRCVAIAAHGKRCQQSPFRGSPYCWHHTQSRKIWAPSRPPSAARPATGAAAGATADGAGRNGRAGAHDDADRRAGRAAEEAAALRLAHTLGPEKVEELIEFLEGPSHGAYLLVRDEAGIMSERSVSGPAAERRSASA
ncbi:hypothetical protein [Miltoncostaea marina]|uniref:hypothetical protein n=1 Tax=Miltoncostaea marina TaxID=2843215 RepID=UPI001C3D5765|nr:hypothetical protein [Miltoncostaea marina]